MKTKIRILAVALFLSGCVAPVHSQTTKSISIQEMAKKIPDSLKKEYVVIPAKVMDSLQVNLKAKNEKIAELKNDLVTDIFGGIKPIHYAGAFIFAFMAIFIRWSIMTIVAVRNNPATPTKFNLWWFLLSSLKKISRVIAALLIVFVFLRFTNEFFGFGLTMFIAFMIGLFYDFLSDKLKRLDPTIIFAKFVNQPNK